ncbi:VOC family protein [Paenibacillus albus]|uniref:VOC family protein n=1 Tax=Paenibacillus albus TaxID=2495582 RepID=A0A3S9A7I1_9BACL|nr:VOC family protein [Paenibacillus albus]AZN41695.1 VOC family protein [Paenibacillus albus]
MRVHHYSIEVRDLNQSSDFYENILGFKEESRMHLNGERVLFLTLGAARLELVQPESPAEASPPSSRMHLAFEVVDLNPLLDRMLHAGCEIVEGPIRLDMGWSCVFLTGPDGEMLEFIQI